MSATAVLVSRVKAELTKLVAAPPPGVSCWPVGDSMVDFEASTFRSVFNSQMRPYPILTIS